MNAANLYDLLVSQSTHLAVLFFVIWGLVGLCRRQSAHLRYLLWAVIMVKCLVPPVLTVPLAVLPEKGTPVGQPDTTASRVSVPGMKPVEPTTTDARKVNRMD